MAAQKTPLYEKHVAYGGEIVDYAGWLLPVKYEGLAPEHHAVRNDAGLFDVSHMGEITVKGKDAFDYVNHLITNDLTTIGDGQVIYSLLCNENGGVVDDLLVYRKGQDDMYIVVNAANTDKDFDWFLKQKGNYDVEIKNISSETAQIALQGPKAEKVLQKLAKNVDLANEIKFFTFKENVELGDCGKFLVSRTGYTGEDGFEIYGNGEDMCKLWDEILKIGKEDGVKPCGLGCRDTLRFEAGLPLYGNEMDDVITPLEAGLGYFVKLKQEADFIGKKVLAKIKEAGLPRKLIGVELKGKGIARHGTKVFKGDKEIGFVTTGYLSPTLNKTIANVIVDADQAEVDNEVEVELRNKRVPAVLISKKFLKK